MRKEKKKNQAILVNKDKNKTQSADHTRTRQHSPVTQLWPVSIEQLLRWAKKGLQKSGYSSDYNWWSLSEQKWRNTLEKINTLDVARWLTLTRIISTLTCLTLAFPLTHLPIKHYTLSCSSAANLINIWNLLCLYTCIYITLSPVVNYVLCFCTT